MLPLLGRIGFNSIESRSSVVGIMTRLRHGCPRNYGSIPGRVKGFISSLETSRTVLSPTLPPFQWAPVDFFPGYGTVHSFPPCAEGKDEWS
jgi:hypothetical protein